MVGVTMKIVFPLLPAATISGRAVFLASSISPLELREWAQPLFKYKREADVQAIG